MKEIRRSSILPKKILNEIEDCDDKKDIWRKIVYYHENPKKKETQVQETSEEEVKSVGTIDLWSRLTKLKLIQIKF